MGLIKRLDTHVRGEARSETAECLSAAVDAAIEKYSFKQHVGGVALSQVQELFPQQQDFFREERLARQRLDTEHRSLAEQQSSEPVEIWIVPHGTNGRQKAVYVPTGYAFGSVSLGEAVGMWENGVVVPTSGADRTSFRIRPCKDLSVSDWADNASKKHFSNWVLAFKKLDVLLRLSGKDAYISSTPILESCAEFFRRKHRCRGYHAAARQRVQRCRGDYTTQPMSRKMRTVYLYFASVPHEDIEDWYHKVYSAHQQQNAATD